MSTWLVHASAEVEEQQSQDLLDENQLTVAADRFANAAGERRRPGRLRDAHPSLIPLLRGEAAAEWEPGEASEDGMAAATGIAVSLLLSGLIVALVLVFVVF